MKKKIVVNIFLILFLIALVSWREVQILIDRGSWRAYEHLNIFWYTNQNDWWEKNFDSFHVSNGVATMVVCYFIARYVFSFNIKFLGKVQTTVLTLLFWVIGMQIRNLFMLVV